MSSTIASKQNATTKNNGTRLWERALASGKLWHRSAPENVSKACQPGEEGAGWSAWGDYLAERNAPRSLQSILGSKRSLILEGISLGQELSPLVDLLQAAPGTTGSKKKRRGETTDRMEASLESWLCQNVEAVRSREQAAVALTIAHALPELAARLAAGLWWSLLERLVELSKEAALGAAEAFAWTDHCSTTRKPLIDNVIDDTIAFTLLSAGELPLALAYLFPELRPCRKLKKTASSVLSASVVGLCDGAGTLPFPLLRVHSLLVASWTRSLVLAETNAMSKHRTYSPAAREQLSWLVEQTLRNTRSDGSTLLSPSHEAILSPALFSALLHLAGDASDFAAAKTLPAKTFSPSGTSKKKKQNTHKKTGGYASADLSEPSSHSEWAGWTVMRSNWTKASPRVAIGIDGTEFSLECETGKEMLFSGLWNLDIALDGKKQKLTSEWEESCWFSDDDLDYLELSANLTGDGLIERQIIFARQDGFLMLVDNITSGHAIANQQGGSLEYRASLPLAEGLLFVAEKETRDGLLVGKRPVASVLPLALPEWRIENRVGELQSTCAAAETPKTNRGKKKAAPKVVSLNQSKTATSLPSAITWSHHSAGRASGCALCSPIFIDLKPNRAIKDRTWRQLTIAESLEIVSPEVAAGFRIQCGKQQWLYYRSLAKCANRTLLGQNLSGEFFLGKFSTKGTVKELMEIESGE